MKTPRPINSKLYEDFLMMFYHPPVICDVFMENRYLVVMLDTGMRIRIKDVEKK